MSNCERTAKLHAINTKLVKVMDMLEEIGRDAPNERNPASEAFDLLGQAEGHINRGGHKLALAIKEFAKL